MEQRKAFITNERTNDLIIQVQQSIKEQHGHDEILGSVLITLVKDQDGVIHCQIINRIPFRLFNHAVNVAALQMDFSQWIHDTVQAALAKFKLEEGEERP